MSGKHKEATYVFSIPKSARLRNIDLLKEKMPGPCEYDPSFTNLSKAPAFK